MPTDSRLLLLSNWIHSKYPEARLEPASEDASFRRYFRVYHASNSWIAMDAPPDKGSLDSFLDITTRLQRVGVVVPNIYHALPEQGFLLITDFGRIPYLSALSADSVDELYQDALSTLIKLQGAETEGLPVYDQGFLQMELELMPEWFLSKHLGITLSNTEQLELQGIFNQLIASALEQPQVFVHRDYHSRNLMHTPEFNPGVIDYQDAVLGPVCYDAVSLLRDCYIAWPEQQVVQWRRDFQALLVQQGTVSDVSEETFQRWFDWIGLQRHLKVLGIFARLCHRDGKSHYLNDLPLTLSYILSVASRYPELSGLVDLLTRHNVPQRIGTIEGVI